MVSHPESRRSPHGVDPVLALSGLRGVRGSQSDPRFDGIGTFPAILMCARLVSTRSCTTSSHGAAEDRHPSPKAEVAARKQKLLAAMTRNDKILEIGPSFSPIAPKSEGWNSFSLDHASMDELKEKYQAYANLDVSKVEPVDFVWKLGPIESAVPSNTSDFLACIASHVLSTCRIWSALQCALRRDCPRRSSRGAEKRYRSTFPIAPQPHFGSACRFRSRHLKPLFRRPLIT